MPRTRHRRYDDASYFVVLTRRLRCSMPPLFLIQLLCFSLRSVLRLHVQHKTGQRPVFIHHVLLHTQPLMHRARAPYRLDAPAVQTHARSRRYSIRSCPARRHVRCTLPTIVAECSAQHAAHHRPPYSLHSSTNSTPSLGALSSAMRLTGFIFSFSV